MSDLGRSNIDIGQRLVALRKALGYDKPAAFARHVELLPQALNNYERGFRRPDLDAVSKIKRKTGVTMDWIYEGDRAGLPTHLAAIIPDLSEQQAG